MDSPFTGLIAILVFFFLTLTAFMIWSYVTDKMKFEAIKLAKELAEKVAELEKSQNMNKGDDDENN